MIIKKAAVNDSSVYVTYPVFSDGDSPESLKRINNFYETLRDCAMETSRSLPPGHRYSAEYTVTDTDGILDISYTVRIRHCGRSIFTRCFSHRWKNGVIVSEQK